MLKVFLVFCCFTALGREVKIWNGCGPATSYGVPSTDPVVLTWYESGVTNNEYTVFYLPKGPSVLDIPDGTVWVSGSTNYESTFEVGGTENEGVECLLSVVIGDSSMYLLCRVSQYKLPWWYFALGVSFALPFAGFGFFVRIVRRVIAPSSEV
jgi:hypothetical protein